MRIRNPSLCFYIPTALCITLIIFRLQIHTSKDLPFAKYKPSGQNRKTKQTLIHNRKHLHQQRKVAHLSHAKRDFSSLKRNLKIQQQRKLHEYNTKKERTSNDVRSRNYYRRFYQASSATTSKGISTETSLCSLTTAL